jgi:glutaredoxin-like protein
MAMALLQDDVAAQLKSEFAKLVNPVRLVVFSQAMADPESEQVRRLVEELAALDEKLVAEPVNFVLDRERVEQLRIERTPAVAVLSGDQDYGIRFYGMPSGYEFGALVDAVMDVSSGDSGLTEETRMALARLDAPVHVRVFSTPTCPHCPRAVRLAYRFAIQSPHVTADGIEVTGYPELARRYAVSAVPKTVVGESVEFLGAGPEDMLLRHVQQAAGTSEAAPEPPATNG